MSLFLLFLLALPFFLTGDDMAKGCAIVVVLFALLILAIAGIWIVAGALELLIIVYEWFTSLFN